MKASSASTWRARCTLYGVRAQHAPKASCSAGKFDVVFTYDVLHDATNPEELMRLVRASLGDSGVWVIADIKTCGCTACREAA